MCSSRKILSACLVGLLEIVLVLSSDTIVAENVELALTLFSTAPKNYASAWGEVYRCDDHKEQSFEIHGLPTALSVTGAVDCTPDPAKPSLSTCRIPVQIKWLRIHALINSTEGQSISLRTLE